MNSGLRMAFTCTVDSKRDFSGTVGSEGLPHAQRAQKNDFSFTVGSEGLSHAQ